MSDSVLRTRGRIEGKGTGSCGEQHDQEERNEPQQKLDEHDIKDEEEAIEAEQAQVTVSEGSKTGPV